MSNVIITGKQGSGKNWIANAITCTHNPDRILYINVPTKTIRRLKDILKDFRLHLFYDVVVFDECTMETILVCEDAFNNRACFIYNPFTNEEKKLSIPKLSIIYLTQENIEKEMLVATGVNYKNIHLVKAQFQG